jgi:hypothetical protein
MRLFYIGVPLSEAELMSWYKAIISISGAFERGVFQKIWIQ